MKGWGFGVRCFRYVHNKRIYIEEMTIFPCLHFLASKHPGLSFCEWHVILIFYFF